MAPETCYGGNWKMNNTYAEAISVGIKHLNNHDKHGDSVDIARVPPSSI